MKKLSIILLSVITILCNITVVHADTVPKQDENHQKLPYIITAYDVNIDVHEDNTCHIVERITAYFNESRHGIIRNIPVKQTIVRANGSRYTAKHKIDNVKVNTSYVTERNGNDLSIKIGRSTKTVLGEVQYEITYDYSLGNDSLPNMDEFYFNLIGPEWDTYINNVSFTVNMPKSFSQEVMGFTTGKIGSLANPDLAYSVEGNTISGVLNEELEPYHALTFRLELPDGYFTSTPAYDNLFMLGIPIALLLLTFIIWFIWGRDRIVPKTVEVIPPDNICSAQLGTIYRGKAGDKEFVSILISLASKGYIKIQEVSSGGFAHETEFIITILREYLSPNDYNEVEELFLRGLVSQSKHTGKNSSRVIRSSNMDTFYKTKEKILSKLNSKENKRKYFEYHPFFNILIGAFMVACYCAITYIPVVACAQDPDTGIMGIIFPGIAIAVIVSTMSSRELSLKIFGLIWGIGFGGLPWCFAILPVIIEYDNGISYLFGVVCIVLMGIFLKLMPQRTQYGAELYAKTCGYKDYLTLVEEDRIKLLADQSPEYFYSVLPYAYVLDVTDKWISRFKNLGIVPPTWFVSSSDDIDHFSHSITSTLSSLSHVSRTPASSGGGDYSGGSSSSSGGGGSSGGGSGGGGGSSW